MIRFRCRVSDPAVRPIVRCLGTALLLLLVVRTQVQSYEHVIVTAGTFVRSFAPLGQFVEDEPGLRDTTVTVEYRHAHYFSNS